MGIKAGMKLLGVFAAVTLVCILGRGCYRIGEGLLLVDAALHGNVVQVRRLLNDGVNPNSDDDGTPALLAATCEGGHTEVMQILLAKGANVNARGINGYTPLLGTATTNAENVTLLLKYKANVNAQDNDGHTALMIASENAEINIVHILLLGGAKVNIKDSSGQTALMKAASIQYNVPANNLVATVKALILSGADVNDKDNTGKTAMTMAIKYGHSQAAVLLKKSGAKK